MVCQSGPRSKDLGTKANRNFAQGGRRVYRGVGIEDSKNEASLTCQVGFVVRIITLEDHFATPMFQERFPEGNVSGHFLADSGRYLGYDISAELLNLNDSRLAAMDAAGIDVQVVSLTMPGCEAFEGETAMAMATDANDRLAEATRAHPTRLAGFASLPTASPATAAKELERAVTKLGFKGAMINGHVRGEFLDNQKYWAIFECAQALNVPIYLHPTIPHPDVLKAYFNGYYELATPAWGFAMDTCTHFLRFGLRRAVRRLSKS